MLSIPLTAQTILNENTGKVITTPERIKNAARFIKDWHRMDSVLQVRERQLKTAEDLLDSLSIELAVQTRLNLQYLQERDARDQQLNNLANEEIDIYKGLSRGLHLDAYGRSQLYSLESMQPSLPAVLGGNLNFAFKRHTIGLGLQAILISFQLKNYLTGAVFLEYKYRIF